MENMYKDLPVSFSTHARDSMRKRGTNEDEVLKVVKQAEWIEAKKGRFEAKLNLDYNQEWNNKRYSVKQVNPVFIIENQKIIIITVYVFYF